MKFPIVTIAFAAFVVVAVAASVAQAVDMGNSKRLPTSTSDNGRYKSVEECNNFSATASGPCRICCNQFDLVGVPGRHLLLTPGLRQCKCITREEDETMRANRG